MDVSELIRSFLWTIKIEKRLSLNSFNSYEYDLKVFISWIKEKKVNIEHELMLNWFAEYLKEERGNSKRTITRKINIIISFFKYCNEEKGTAFYIPEKINQKISKTYRPFVESKDLNKMRDYLSKDRSLKGIRIYCLVEVLYSTGLRVSELLSIKKTQFYEIQKNRSLYVIGKGNRERVVFFSDIAIELIEEYLKITDSKEELLFPITRQRVFQIIKELSAVLSIDPKTLFPHAFRHRILTDLLKRGMNIVNVQRIAGHQNISTTENYTHVEDYLYEEIEKHHPVFKMLND